MKTARMIPYYVVTNVTAAAPAVVTVAAHDLQNGDLVRVAGVVGPDAANGVWKVANRAATTFELEGSDTSGQSAYDSGGTVEMLNADAGAHDSAISIPGKPFRIQQADYPTGRFLVTCNLDPAGLNQEHIGQIWGRASPGGTWILLDTLDAADTFVETSSGSGDWFQVAEVVLYPEMRIDLVGTGGSTNSGDAFLFWLGR